jgi:hypothetical protein
MTRPARLPRAARAVLTAVTFVVAAGGWFGVLAAVGGASATAEPVSACTPTSGTIVAVDFGHWAGPVVRGCGVGDASGYDLLHDGGFATSGTQHDGPGFVCRIGSRAFHGGTQYPTPSQDACVTTPPANAYWTFWVAEPGQTGWTYGRVGAVSYHPQPGEVEVWRFGATPTDGSSGAPPYSPATLRAVPVPSTPAPRPHPSTPASTTVTPLPPPPSTSAAASKATEPVHSTRRVSTARSSASSDPAEVIFSRSKPVVVAASPAAAAESATTSAMPTLLGAAAVVLLAAGAGGLAWRRRSQRR